MDKVKSLFNINTNEMNDIGPYPFYNKIGKQIAYHDTYNYDVKKCILITKDGGCGQKVYGDNISLGGVMIIEDKFTSTYANFVLQIKDDEYINFIYYLLKLNKNNIMDLANFSVKIGHIQYGKLAKLKIKIPKNKQLVTDMESTFQEIETLQMEIKSAEELYKQYIQELSNEAKPSNIKANNDESKVVIIEQVQEPIIKIRKIKKKITV